MTRPHIAARRRGRALPTSGAALFTSLLTVVVLSGMSVAVLSVSLAGHHESRMAIARARALSAAEAGVGDAYLQLAAKKTPSLGSKTAPKNYSGDRYWGKVVTNADGTYTITSVGRSGNARRALEVVVQPGGGGVFQNAIFAGNSLKDPNYTLKFGGLAKQADVIVGNVYSGGAITFSGAATIKGQPSATGKITKLLTTILATVVGQAPAKALEGVKEPIPDIAGMGYATNNDVDVAKEFKAAKLTSDDAGGKAYQLPETNPAHIFRLNPDDRKTNTAATTKDDYFLEDPYDTLRGDSNSDGTDAYRVSLSSPTATKGAVNGNNKVYYIDGNLWIHNLSTMSMKFYTAESSGVQVTFVVKGNIYISDNIFLTNAAKDGVAFIATKDAAVKDSGNVYFGDPTFGTLEQMNAFLYAENNFYDNNLSATGSALVTLNGNMTAGNQVAINRDSGTQHSKLTVNFDGRIAGGALKLPGLPKSSGVTTTPSILVWREVGVPKS